MRLIKRKKPLRIKASGFTSLKLIDIIHAANNGMNYIQPLSILKQNKKASNYE